LRPRWWLEIALIGGYYEAYESSRAAAPTRPDEAVRHGHAVSSLEHVLHLGVEGPINHLVASHLWLALASGYYYCLLHFIGTVATLVWLYGRRPELYRRARNAILLASFTALLVFWSLPVAPPRLASPGMTDILVSHNIFGAAHAAKPGGFVNVYAAIPSLHVGWAVWVAATLYAALPGRRWRAVVWAYPVTTTLVVVGTANHFITDAAAGAALMSAALFLTGFGRRRISRVQEKQHEKPTECQGLVVRPHQHRSAATRQSESKARLRPQRPVRRPHRDHHSTEPTGRVGVRP
jgi:hypothetical protein